MDTHGVRRKEKGKWWVVAVVVGTVVVVGVGIFLRGFFAHPNRISVVLMNDPVVVASWDTASRTFVVVSLPAGTTIDGTHGYGLYSLEALWKLGAIDKRGGILLTESIEELLGLPVPWYISESRSGEHVQTKDPIGKIKDTFSFTRLVPFLTGKYVSNMPFSSFVALSAALGGVRTEGIGVIDLAKGDVLVDQTLPDGSVMHVVDKDRLDQKIGLLFEDERIRKEGLSLAIYNTTQSPSLGTRVARLLSHAGIRVISVGNDSPELSRCSLTGRQKELASITARFIVRVYGCSTTIKEDSSTRADLTLRVGTSYQSRFLPFH